ncbi:hypothetical protein [Variovorax sp. DT-64]|uniref:hypothetical protein n=1 Tax=Variovorax sp. DT-64 TaxID=3396160 RepID=UPI003F1AC715
MATRLTGKVVGLGADREGVNIVLDNDPAIGPKDNQWTLENGHSNFNALFSLALAAAANRWPLVIRIQGDGQIDPAVPASIRNMAVSWKADD